MLNKLTRKNVSCKEVLRFVKENPSLQYLIFEDYIKSLSVEDLRWLEAVIIVERKSRIK